MPLPILGVCFEICGGVLALAWMVLTIYVMIQILFSSLPTIYKVLWCVAIWFLPFLGPIMWLVWGSKKPLN